MLEFQAAWSDLSDSLIDRVLVLLVSAPQPNVLRPASAIVGKFVMPTSQFDKMRKGKGKARARDDPDSVLRPQRNMEIGFDRVWNRMQDVVLSAEGPNGAIGMFKVLSRRLEGAGDLELVVQT